MFDKNLIDFSFQDCFHDNGSHSNSLDNVIIFQMHIVRSDYLIRVKCGPMRSHVLGGSQIYDPHAYVLTICFILYYKCAIVIVFCILCSFWLLVLCFVAKTCNVARFVTIEIRFCTLAQKWFVAFRLLRHHSDKDSFSLRFNISCVKHAVT
jgi:hypothetical protein